MKLIVKTMGLMALSFGLLSACGAKKDLKSAQNPGVTQNVDTSLPTTSKPFEGTPAATGAGRTLPKLRPDQHQDLGKDILPESNLPPSQNQPQANSGSGSLEFPTFPGMDASELNTNQVEPYVPSTVNTNVQSGSVASSTSTSPVTKPPTVAKPPTSLASATLLQEEEETLEFCKDKALFTNQKKEAFLCALLPAAIRMNKLVFQQRLQIQSLEDKEATAPLTSSEQTWLSQIKAQYGLTAKNSYDDLLQRVDVVPLSLLMTQSAIESGWGSSRAATEAKNFFGIHGNPKTDNCMMAASSNICIKKYSNADESLSDYIHFLNTQKATQSFRELRAQMRNQQQDLDSIKLAGTLVHYSELGQTYVNQVRSMMAGQNFVKLVSEEETKEG